MKCVRSPSSSSRPCSSRLLFRQRRSRADRMAEGAGPWSNGSVLPLGPPGSFDEVSNFTISPSKMAPSTSCTMAVRYRP